MHIKSSFVCQGVSASVILTCPFLNCLNLGSNIDDVISSIRSLNVLTEMFKGNDSILAAPNTEALNGTGYESFAPHSAALNVSHNNKVRRSIVPWKVVTKYCGYIVTKTPV